MTVSHGPGREGTDAGSSGTSLFPPIEPYATGRLALEEPHELYWEESGNPQGLPILFLHGGPGGGAGPIHRRFFDPTGWRIVIFDQRGAGRSTPGGEIAANTTPDLVADIERLREARGIDRWAVFGGSWGSALALAYGEAHPDRCLGLILRGIFLGERAEIAWFLSGLRTLSPRAWNEFAAAVGPIDPAGLLDRYRERLADPDPNVSVAAATAWALYEARSSTLLPNPTLEAEYGSAAKAYPLARIEAHYFAHDCFFEPGQLLRGVERIRWLPGSIVQGRYDLLCPMLAAERLHEAWPAADYVLVPDAGHSAFEPPLTRALVAATERLRSQLWRTAD
jgi:proline iminopeptidase